MRLTDLLCLRLSSNIQQTPGDFSRCAKFAAANQLRGTAAEDCARQSWRGDHQARARSASRQRGTLPQRRRPAPSHSESLNAVAGPPFDRFLIRSEDQLTCGVPGIDRPQGTLVRVFPPLPKTNADWISARKEPVCQLSPGRERPPSSFPVLLSVCSTPARSPSGSAFPSITCRRTPRGGTRGSRRCAWASVATDGRCCGFGAKTLRNSSSTTWANLYRCAGEHRERFLRRNHGRVGA